MDKKDMEVITGGGDTLPKKAKTILLKYKEETYKQIIFANMITKTNENGIKFFLTGFEARPETYVINADFCPQWERKCKNKKGNKCCEGRKDCVHNCSNRHYILPADYDDFNKMVERAEGRSTLPDLLDDLIKE